MDMQSAIRNVTERRDLTETDMLHVMRLIMTGEATSAQIGGFLVGLRMKGETVDEITAAARVMRELVTPVPVTGAYLVDTCGTGGDGASTFNISTASAIVTAAAGAQVAKHGNRSVSSSCGSADVLELAGVNLELTVDQLVQCVDEIGVGFLFAPRHHSAMKHAIGPRREMSVRTLFNLLGPLTNPAGAPNQVLGVFNSDWLTPLAEVLGRLGSRHVMVVHADDGLDEISIGSPTQVAELKDGTVARRRISPEQFGLSIGRIQDLSVVDAAASLKIINDVFDDTPGAARDIVLLNAGAAIYVSGIAASLEDGVVAAREAVVSGKARRKFQELIETSNRFR